MDVTTVLKGVEAWAAAVGEDPVPEAIARWRAQRCAGCDIHAAGPLGTGWCGRVLEAGEDARGAWCGCLVTLTVDGVTSAAGKTRVRGEECPRGAWWAWEG